MSRKVLLVVMVLILTTIAIPTASATNTVDTFNLNQIYCNCITNGSSDGGVVTLTQVGTSGEVDFNVTLDSTLNFHDTNSFDAFAFSFIGSGLSISSVTFGTGSFAWNTTAQGSGSMDGAGKNFNEFIDWTGAKNTGGNTGVTNLQFDVFGTGITLANFEVLNGNTVDFAAAVSNTNQTSCTGVIGGGNATSDSTAVASNGKCISGPTVPEPTSVLLLGTALAFAGKFLKGYLAS